MKIIPVVENTHSILIFNCTGGKSWKDNFP